MYNTRYAKGKKSKGRTKAYAEGGLVEDDIDRARRTDDAFRKANAERTRSGRQTPDLADALVSTGIRRRLGE